MSAIAYAALPAYADGRVALLVGNSEYVLGSLPLPTPVNDVAALDQSLSRLGFKTQVLEDADRTKMQKALTIFADRAKGAEIALFFFAGHAVRLAGTNYLLLTSIPEVSRECVVDNALNTREILKSMRSAAPDIGIVILSTAHGNPFTREREGVPAIAKPRLALPTKEEVEDMFVVHATEAREKAIDGQGHHSAFTTALLQNIETPGLTVRGMFRLIRQKLPHGQLSIQQDELGSHYMKQELDVEIRLTKEKELAEKAMSTGDLALFHEYEKHYPKGAYRTILKIHEEVLISPPHVPDSGIPEPGVSSIEDVPRDQLPRVRAALAVMGLYGTGDKGIADRRRLQTAADEYRSIYGRRDLDVDRLIADAGRRALLVGAGLSRDISRDLDTLRGIEGMHNSAKRHLKSAEAKAARHPLRDKMLAASRNSVAAIQSILETNRRRLDQKWDLYVLHLDRSKMLNLPESDQPGTTAQSDDYEQLFRKHVRAQQETDKPDGFSWLDDFRPQK